MTPKKPRLTDERVRNAIRRYQAAHGGANPTKDSGDATPYFGFTEKWSLVERALTRRQRGILRQSSLVELCQDVEFTRGLTFERLKAAILRYRELHRGEDPTMYSEDATPYFGVPAHWSRVDEILRGMPLPGVYRVFTLCEYCTLIRG